MSIVDCEQKKFLDELNRLKKRAKCLQQEVKCLEAERSDTALENEDRLKSEKRLECYEQRMKDLERKLTVRTRQVQEAKDCYRSLKQELHQFNIRLDCKRQCEEKMKDGNKSSSSNGGTEDNRNNSTKTMESSQSAADQTQFVNSGSAPVAAEGQLSEQQQLELAQQQWDQQQLELAQQQWDQQQMELAQQMVAEGGIEPTDYSEASPDCVDTPPGINQEPIDSLTPVRICEISAKGKYIRLSNATSQETDVGGHFIVQRQKDGPTTVFQFPVSVPLPGKATVTVWSGSSGANRDSPPTDFVFYDQPEWLTGQDCTTVLCQPDKQAMSWMTSNSESTVAPCCAAIQLIDPGMSEEERKRLEEEERKRLEEEERLRMAGEGSKKAAEEDAKKKAEEEAKRKKAEEEAKRKKAEEEAKKNGTKGKTGEGKSCAEEKKKPIATKRSKSRSQSRSRSRNRKQKQEAAAAAAKKKDDGAVADCECDFDKEEVDDAGCEDTSSDDCECCDDDDDDDDECGAEEDELVDCWWGERRCSLAKTIPCPSIHLDDFNATKKKKGQGSNEDGACRGREFNECSSSISLAACDEGRNQKTSTTTDYKYNCEIDCSALVTTPTKQKVSKKVVAGDCSTSAPPSVTSKTKKKGCGSLGVTKTKKKGCDERPRTKTLREEFGCFSNHDLRKDVNQLNICPCEVNECEGQGKGQGWFGSWSSWFSRRCPTNKEEEEAKKCKEVKREVCCEEKKVKKRICCDDKKVTKGCCDDKKVTKLGCDDKKVTKLGCDDKKVTKGCCDDKKVTKGCCDDKKVTKGCCEEKKVTRLCCEEKKVTRGHCEEKKVTRGCCDEKKVTKGCCDDKKVTKGCCDEKKVSRGCCDEKNFFARGCCEDELSMEGGCCESERKATKKKTKRSKTCCEEEEEEDCVDPCQKTGRRYDSDFVIVSSRSDPHLASGGGGRRSRRGGGGGCGGGGGVRGVRQDGIDELGCPCACRQSDSFAVTTASLMAAGLTVAAMYCA